MATQNQVMISAFSVAFCLLMWRGGAHSSLGPKFLVEGQVYCEVCRTNFINKLSEPMPGATVRLECRGEDEGNITYSQEGVTDGEGKYHLTVEGDHGEEECAVTLFKSSRGDCSEIPDEGWATKPSSKVILTRNSGFHDDTRIANPIAFTTKKAAPKCGHLMKELQIIPNEL
ncbi:major pollen allergen Ole e 1 [Striga asiatica]|uniref:Major pollen allergen Ole e 1 n=1 Tax=Striga asiatica TaxID=4170 RepID=A0A5A7P0M6_STRAF|nr:major pollen allergen Ole e 1 [Striga asiatica]